jgi:hypothetical protein
MQKNGCPFNICCKLSCSCRSFALAVNHSFLFYSSARR